jgi:site-specific DNA-adenine methylase
MELSQFLPLSITFVVTLIGSYITIKVTIAELKKDLVFLKDKLETELTAKVQHETQAKEDMREVKDDLKMIFKSIFEFMTLYKVNGNHFIVISSKSFLFSW